ncbi:hypothetical protein NXW43_12770 [Bacteroides thetaiotaomicron]|nr:hypothetical protein NXW43_12770 [Bacteroides thetaiotaomicron]
MPGSILPPTVGTSSSGEKSDSLLPGVEYTRCMHCSLYTRFNVENAGGIFLWGEQGYVSGFPKTLAPRARRLLGGQIRSRRSQILE